MLLPEDKDKAVTELQARGHTVAMVGDGVNDALALAAGVLAWAGFVLPMAVGATLMSSSTMIVGDQCQSLRRIDQRPAPIADTNSSPSARPCSPMTTSDLAARVGLNDAAAFDEEAAVQMVRE